MATQGEKLQTAYNQFVKAKGEIIAKIAELQTAHNGEGVTDELVNSFVTLGQQLDDVVPDEIPTGDDGSNGSSGSTGSSDGSDTPTGSTGTDSGDAGSTGADSSTGSESADPNADANAAGRPAKAE